MQEPFLTDETFKFDNNKVVTIETEYLNFNESLWEKNLKRLVNWIDKNYPELNDFNYDQTESGALAYLKAITLYRTENNL